MEKVTTGWQLIIHDIEYLPLDARRQPGQDHGFSAVVDVSQRYLIGTPKMQKQAKGPDTRPAGDRLVPRAINNPRPNDDIRQCEFATIFDDEFVLLCFG